MVRRGWPALAEVNVDGWVARLSDGVTQRGNSVAPFGEPADPLAALEQIERIYRGRGLPAIFQVGPVAKPLDLDTLLAARGYEFGSPTSVEVADVDTVLGRVPEGAPVDVTDSPDKAWLDLWWAVDGRGDTAARATARRILTARPAYYASVRDADGTVAVGRLALVGEWGGLYCLAVRPDARRRGLGAAVVGGLLAHAGRHGIRRCWLQVRADNLGARALYARLGFAPAARYHYRTNRYGGHMPG